MKVLRKIIPTLVITGLLCANGAMTSQAEVASNKINAPQNAKKGQDLKPATDGSKNVKDLIGSSVNKAENLKSKPQNMTFSKTLLMSQKSEDSSLRDRLRIKPLNLEGLGDGSAINYPSLNFATPSGFGANWGDFFIAASASTADKVRIANQFIDTTDISIVTGFGVGNSRETVGIEVDYNLGSIRRFASNGSFDIKAHRIIYSGGTNIVSASVGWNAFAQYGNEGVIPSSVYGAVTSYSLLQADNAINKMPISFTVGAGGGVFRQGSASTGVFAGVGVQVAPQLSFGGGWSGVGLNLGASYVPVPSIPLTIGLIGVDLADNSVGGRVLLLNVSYGFNFLPK